MTSEPLDVPLEQVPKLMQLLWRGLAPRARQPGPRPRIDTDRVVAAAIAAADRSGLEALTIRSLASDLGVRAMTIYSHVPGKPVLVALMVDEATKDHALVLPQSATASARVRSVVEADYRLHIAHPWLADAYSEQPPLGPGTIAKYERELEALWPLGLGDEETDAVLTFLLGFARAAAGDTVRRARLAVTNREWWEAAGPALARFFTESDYPLASRIGTAAGMARGGAYNAEAAYRFGLDRVTDAVDALLARRFASG